MEPLLKAIPSPWRSTVAVPPRKAMFLHLLVCLVLGLSQSSVWGHGGAPRMKEEIVGPYKVSVWTSPAPLRVGRMHLSVGITRAQDSAPILDTHVHLRAYPIDHQENQISTVLSRSNMFLYDADLEILHAGEWEITLQVEGKEGNERTGFKFRVEPPAKINWSFVGASAVFFLLLGIVRRTVHLRRAYPREGR